MKKCTKCGKEYPLESFGKDKRNNDGRIYECRICRAKYMKEYQDKNKDRLKEYRQEYKKREKSIIKRRKNDKKHYKKNYYKLKARSLLRVGLIWNKIKKPNYCEHCGKKRKLEGHHEDYDKPREVIWLCNECHNILHRNKRMV